MQGELEELESLAAELLPEGHAMHGHLQRSLRMLQVAFPPPFFHPSPVEFAALTGHMGTYWCSKLCFLGGILFGGYTVLR